MFICWKNVTSSRIPGAESGGGTLTAFRLLKESVRPADFPTRPTGSPGRGAGGAEHRRLPAAPPASRAGRAAAPPRWVPRPDRLDRGTGYSKAAFLQGTKVGLTPSATGCGCRCVGQPVEQPRVPPPPPGPSTGLWGRGRARRPFPAARREDLLMKSSPPSRRRPSLTSAPRRPPVLLPQPPLNPAETTAPQRH